MTLSRIKHPLYTNAVDNTVKNTNNYKVDTVSILKKVGAIACQIMCYLRLRAGGEGDDRG